MSLRETPKGIQSKYVKSANGRIFLNSKSLALQSEMSAIDIQGFEDPVPETVDQLNAMIAEAIKKPVSTDSHISSDKDPNDIFDFSKANKATIAKKAKELFDFDLVIEDKDIADVRKEYEFLLVTSGKTDDDTGSGSN